jgi:hypothetical protein
MIGSPIVSTMNLSGPKQGLVNVQNGCAFFNVHSEDVGFAIFVEDGWVVRLKPLYRFFITHPPEWTYHQSEN